MLIAPAIDSIDIAVMRKIYVVFIFSLLLMTLRTHWSDDEQS